MAAGHHPKFFKLKVRPSDELSQNDPHLN